MTGISTNFLDLKVLSISDVNTHGGIYWKKAEEHLACTSCIPPFFTNRDLTIKDVFTCYICEKKIPVDVVDAQALAILDWPQPERIFYLGLSSSSITPTLKAVADLYRIRKDDPITTVVSLPHLRTITRRLLAKSSS